MKRELPSHENDFRILQFLLEQFNNTEEYQRYWKGLKTIHKPEAPTPTKKTNTQKISAKNLSSKKSTKNDRKKVKSSKTTKKQEKVPAKNLSSSKPKIVDCKTEIDVKSKHFYIQHKNGKTRKFVGLKITREGNYATMKVTCT